MCERMILKEWKDSQEDHMSNGMHEVKILSVCNRLIAYNVGFNYVMILYLHRSAVHNVFDIGNENLTIILHRNTNEICNCKSYDLADKIRTKEGDCDECIL